MTKDIFITSGNEHILKWLLHLIILAKDIFVHSMLNPNLLTKNVLKFLSMEKLRTKVKFYFFAWIEIMTKLFATAGRGSAVLDTVCRWLGIQLFAFCPVK